MTSATTNEGLAELESKIRTLAENNLVSGRPYLLSRLGKDLGADLNELKIRTGKTLAQFLRTHLGSEFSIVGTGANNSVPALVRGPVGPDTANPIAVEETIPTKKKPRYNYRFWAAFSVPLRGGQRFLNLRDFT
jgi:hypothetical protein